MLYPRTLLTLPELDNRDPGDSLLPGRNISDLVVHCSVLLHPAYRRCQFAAHPQGHQRFPGIRSDRRQPLLHGEPQLGLGQRLLPPGEKLHHRHDEHRPCHGGNGHALAHVAGDQPPEYRLQHAHGLERGPRRPFHRERCVDPRYHVSSLCRILVDVEIGSGGFMSDLTFNGGATGASMGNQQYTMRNLVFNNCKTGRFCRTRV